jgi:hypothetical protein
MYSVKKEGYRLLEGMVFTQMVKKAPLKIYLGTSACRDMGDVHMIFTADDLCGSHAFQHNFQLYVARRCAVVENSRFYSNILTGILYLLL